MVFSDNGASAEGGQAGSFNEHRFTVHIRESMDENLAHYDDWGGFTTYNHYSWAWAWAGNTPHKLWKRYTWLGGTRTPLIVHWPGRIGEPGTVRSQFAHAVDLMPTIMGAAGLPIPDEVDGVAQLPVDGVSLLSTLQDPATPELHDTQYFEMMGSRSIYHQGWKATTNHISTGVLDEEELAVGSRNFDEDRWSSSTSRPTSPRRMTGPTTSRNGCSACAPCGTPRQSATTSCRSPTAWSTVSGDSSPRSGRQAPRATFLPGGGPVADESVPMLWGGFNIAADIDTDRERAEGVVFALGDWFGGYALYLVGGRAHFTFARAADTLELAMPSALAAGRHTLGIMYSIDEGGAGRMLLLADGVGIVDDISVEACCRWLCSMAAPDCVSAGTAASPCPRVTRRRRPSREPCTRSRWTRRAPPGRARPTRCAPLSTPTEGRRRSAFSPAWTSAGRPARALNSSRLHDAWGGAFRGGPGGQPLQQRVHGRRHAVQATLEHDLPVEEVGLDRPRPVGQALPAGATSPLPRRGAGDLDEDHPRRSRSSSELATSMPAAASASLPSRCASRAKRAEPALGPRPVPPPRWPGSSGACGTSSA